MADAAIPVDPFNPGQVFACLGFLEVAEALMGEAEGGFTWDGAGATTFTLRAAGDDNPVERVLRFLAEAEVKALAPDGSGLATEGWGVPTLSLPATAPYPFPEPDSPATLPVILSAGADTMVIDHWGDATTRDNVKFWAGAGGYPGAALMRDALSLIRTAGGAKDQPPFALAAPQGSSFRFDWRRDYVPMEAGFSPNSHGATTMLGYPLVEALAAIGLTHARPLRLTKLLYRYGLGGCGPRGALLPPLLLRAALGAAGLGLPLRTFEMRLDWPGQENQARCILETKEITP